MTPDLTPYPFHNPYEATMPSAPRRHAKMKWHHRILIGVQELLLLLLALEMGYLIWVYLSGWFAYCLISLISLAIVWSTCARVTLRVRQPEKVVDVLNTRSLDAVHAAHLPARLSENTTSYLQALGQIWRHK